MGERKGKHTVRLSGRTPPTVRDLKKSDLGGVIFGCTHATMDECLRKQLFGLPSFHFQYVENIEPGMPLFLFNYSDRLLYGIYEAASHGQMDIDLNAWTKNGTGRTGYPSQVRIRTRIQCLPLNEKQYSEIIKNNYHTKRHFWFELDHAQTEGLIALYQSSLVLHRNIPVPIPSRRKETASGLEADCSPDKSEYQESASGSDITWSEENVQGSPSGAACPHLDGENRTVFDHLSDAEGFEFVLQSLQKLQNEKTDCPSPEVLTNGGDTQGVEESYRLAPEPYVLDEDKKKVDEPSTGLHEESRLKESSIAEIENNTISGVSSHGNAELVRIIKVLKEKTETLEKKQVESAVKIQQLRNESGKAIEELKARVKELESKQTIVEKSPDTFAKGYLGSEKAIYLFGGYDGSTWLSSLDCFSPSVDIVKPLKSTSLVCSCASAAALNGNLYVLGGRNGSSWFNTVQCYSPKDDQWTLSPSLIRPKANLAGATIDGKIYAIGGCDEYTCLSDVEMYDPALGRWTNIQPMLQKRFSPAAAELHGVLYAVGGYDGQYYLQSVERYDPRVAYWMSLPSMKTDRGGHSLAVLGDKLYAIGGHNGKEIVSSVEIFDPRVGTWMMGEPMSFARGYSAAAVLDNSIFVIGGMLDNEHLLDTMECYKEGIGWTVTAFQSIGKRAFFSATVL